jgi:hypothetical protein
MVAYTLAALVGQLAHRRLGTDDDVTAAQVADSSFRQCLTGCGPDTARRAHVAAGLTRGNITPIPTEGAHLPRSEALKLGKSCGCA